MDSSLHQTKIITDSEMMEVLKHGSEDYHFRFYDEHMSQFDFNCVDWHWHTELEFFYISSGFVQANIGSEALLLLEGQGAFINSKILHRFTSTVDAKTPNFLCHPTFIAPANSLIYNQYIAPILSSVLQYQIFKPEIAWQNQILSLMQEIFMLQNEPVNELLTLSSLQKLWHILYENLQNSLKQRESPLSPTAQAKLQQIMSYIHAHYIEEITLSELSNQFSLSKTSLLSLFQNNLQISPINYLIHYRLHQASILLQNSEKKLTSIAIETGFHNVEYFCRMFKKHYNITPTEYRKR